MATAARGYGTHTMNIQHGALEPPGVTEVRYAVNDALSAVMTTFVEGSLKATALGIDALDSGDFVTLDDLEKEMNLK